MLDTQPTALSNPETNRSAISTLTTSQVPVGEAEVQSSIGIQSSPDNRFSDLLIQACVSAWRLRQDMVRAMSRLTLQQKAICRRECSTPDKSDAEVLKDAHKLWAAYTKDGEHPSLEAVLPSLVALEVAKQPLAELRRKQERVLTKLGAKLPIADFAAGIRGFGHLALAKVVAECGDLSAYHKGVGGIWMRAGLAVIDGERQRKCTNAEKAKQHRYSPGRRSTFWNIGDALFKAQGKDESAGPYRRIYDDCKAVQREYVKTDLHAHNRALRYMVKELLKHLYEA